MVALTVTVEVRDDAFMRGMWQGVIAIGVFSVVGCETGNVPTPAVESTQSALSAPGTACGCDADCAAIEGQDGVCVHGVCMVRAAKRCPSSGSQEGCPDGTRCWAFRSEEGYLCWPDCNAWNCDGVCDEDGSCAPTTESATSTCDYECSSYCACSPGDCLEGQRCESGVCISAGEPPEAGPGPSCPDLPERDCTGGAAHCRQLTVMDPRVTEHYDDYPINGETWDNQYRTYMRRELKMLLDYASAKTLCKTAEWQSGNGGPLGLGDASEADGAVPGTSDGSPDHPGSSHTNGRDIDLAYYQIGEDDNHLRPVCPHRDWGREQNHCVAEPRTLDIWRTAYFISTLLESSRVRVIGVDGKIGPKLEVAQAKLCELGWLNGSSCNDNKIAYEVTNHGNGWFRHHHHHLHLSLKRLLFQLREEKLDPREIPCKEAGECEPTRVKTSPLRALRQ